MTTSPEESDRLRRDLNAARLARNLALTVNAEAENAGQPEVFSDDDRRAFRRLVHELAARALTADVDISDLVAGDVGIGSLAPAP